MNQIRWGRGRWLMGGLLMGGLLVGVAYGQAPGGQAPAAPAAKAAKPQESSSPNKVVLKVGDKSLTQGEVEGFIQGLSPQAQSALAHQGRRPLGDQLVNMIVLSQEALSHHLDSTPAFNQMLDVHRREILATLAYQEILRQCAVTPEEISKYYASHQSEFEEAKLYQVVVRKKPQGAKEGTPGFTAEEAKTRAEEIRKALISGEDIKKVAEKYQLANVVRVDTYPGIVRRGEMRADLEKAAFELKEGQVSEVFDLGVVLAFIRVDSHKMEELSAVSKNIENTLQKQKIDSALDALKKKANVWLDESYFAGSSQPGPQQRPSRVIFEGPVTLK